MNTRHMLHSLITASIAGLLAAPSAMADTVAADAGLNHELWWLALALLVGFSVVARRASHPTTDATANSAHEAADTIAVHNPVRERLRLINKPDREPQVGNAKQPTLDMPPKKTA